MMIKKETMVIPDLNTWILKEDVYKIINDYIINQSTHVLDKDTLLILRQIKKRIANGEVRLYE